VGREERKEKEMKKEEEKKLSWKRENKGKKEKKRKRERDKGHVAPYEWVRGDNEILPSQLDCDTW